MTTHTRMCAILTQLLGAPMPGRKGWSLTVRRLQNLLPGSSPARDSQHLVRYPCRQRKRKETNFKIMYFEPCWDTGGFCVCGVPLDRCHLGTNSHVLIKNGPFLGTEMAKDVFQYVLEPFEARQVLALRGAPLGPRNPK